MFNKEKKSIVEKIRGDIREYLQRASSKNENKTNDQLFYSYQSDSSCVQYGYKIDREVLGEKIRELVNQTPQKNLLAEAIFEFMRKRNIEKPSEVYGRCGMQRQLFSKLTSPNRTATPKKKTLLQLAIGLRLNLIETEYLLRTVGFAFPVDAFDEAIRLCIEYEFYDYKTINKILEEEIEDSFKESKER